MAKGKNPGAVSGNDQVVKFVKFLSWGKVAQLHNAAGSHSQTVKWVDTVMGWFRSYYESVYDVPLTDKRLLNIISTYAVRYSSWPECERVHTYKFKAELSSLLDRSSITLDDIRAVIVCAPVNPATTAPMPLLQEDSHAA